MVKSRFHISFLETIHTTDIHIFKYKRRITFTKGFTSLSEFFGRNIAIDTFFYFVDMCHCGVVTHFHQFIHHTKIEQTIIIERKTKHYSLLGINAVISLFHNQICQLLNGIIFFGLWWISGHHTSDHKFRVKVLTHYINRKIIINSTIEKQTAIHRNGFVHKRKGHGSSHRITQISPSKNNRFFFVHIGSHTSERHKKFIEIAT